MLLTDAHYRAIGRVAVEAGDIEYFLERLVERLMDTDRDASLALIAGMPFAQLANRVKQLAVVKLDSDSDALELVTAWLTEAKQAMQHRNELLHGSWHLLRDLAAETTTTKRIHLARSGVRHATDVTVEQIEALGVDLAVVIAKAQAMFVAIDNEFGWPIPR